MSIQMHLESTIPPPKEYDVDNAIVHPRKRKISSDTICPDPSCILRLSSPIATRTRMLPRVSHEETLLNTPKVYDVCFRAIHVESPDPEDEEESFILAPPPGFPSQSLGARVILRPRYTFKVEQNGCVSKHHHHEMNTYNEYTTFAIAKPNGPIEKDAKIHTRLHMPQEEDARPALHDFISDNFCHELGSSSASRSVKLRRKLVPTGWSLFPDDVTAPTSNNTNTIHEEQTPAPCWSTTVSLPSTTVVHEMCLDSPVSPQSPRPPPVKSWMEPPIPPQPYSDRYHLEHDDKRIPYITFA